MRSNSLTAKDGSKLKLELPERIQSTTRERDLILSNKELIPGFLNEKDVEVLAEARANPVTRLPSRCGQPGGWTSPLYLTGLGPFHLDAAHA